MAHANDTCGCCEGTQPITPQSVANRPGLEALSYRVGTHATFLETMKARLSSLALDFPTTESDEQGRLKTQRTYPLRDLTTREPDDPSIACLDAWATVADVLTFYQERIANEAYLRTARERRSVLELARLVGYALRPGVAASAWLALELDKDYELEIQPHELKAQSVPGPGDMPQTFENIESLDARFAWNRLQPRLSQPQTIGTITKGQGLTPARPRIYVKGISANLKANDVVLITVGDESYEDSVYHVAEVKPDPANDRTLVVFQEDLAQTQTRAITFDLRPLAEIAERYTAPEVLAEFNVSTETDTAKRVFPLLDELNSRVRAGYGTAESADLALRGPLAGIARERDIAVGGGFERLAPWLIAMTRELEAAAQGVMAAAAREKDSVAAKAAAPSADFTPPDDPLSKVTVGLAKRASVPPRSAVSLKRDISRTFDARADIGMELDGVFDARLKKALPSALANVKVTAESNVRVYVFRAVARPFGHNAPLRPVLKTDKDDNKRTVYQEWDINDPLGTGDSSSPHQEEEVLYLDGEYKIQSSGWILIEGPDVPYLSNRLFLDLTKDVDEVSQLSIGAYGISGKATRLELAKHVKGRGEGDGLEFACVRRTVVYCESEKLPLAEEPLEDSICGGAEDLIELDGLYSGLQSGRWLTVSGERDDIEDGTYNKVRGVNAAELVMLAEVTHEFKKGVSGDRTHTFIKLAKKLEYCYRRDTVTLYGNVVKATQGETRKETLGSGDAAQRFQSFPLKQPPLTFVAAPTPAGAESTLELYINDVQWHETGSLAGLEPADRRFITKTDDNSKTTVVFGNGQQGALLPTGIENIRAQYRSGIGRAGNVQAEQISLLTSKPLGVKAVINPLRASGGADKESRDTARKNAPLTITALDRLVSVSDYADFARTFAGIGKALAARISDGKRESVHVTIAGADDIPIDEGSDLYRNLLQALHDYGDPYQPVALQVRELMLLVISANLRILPDYQWEPVVKAVRAKLLDTFSFARRELGQDVLLAEVIAAIQAVRGVAYVDVDAFGGIPERITDVVSLENETTTVVRRVITPKEIADAAGEFLRLDAAPGEPPQQRLEVNLAGFEELAGNINRNTMRPAQLAYLTPDVADTLVLNQVV